MALRAIFLDFGGTLVEPMSDGYPVFAEVLGARGVPIDRGVFDRAEAIVERPTEARQHAYLGLRPGFWDVYHAEVLDRLGIADPGSEIVAELHEAFTSPRWHPPYEESAGVLDDLQRRGLAMHLVSNNTDYLPELIARLGWTGRFRSISFSQEVGAEKPDRRLFELALARAGSVGSETLHVGDSWDADVVGARGAGISAFWIDRSGRGAVRDAPWAADLRGLLAHLDRGSSTT